jgi:hypothetical protein
MPPYQNESLHDMHVLMQQLNDLNDEHALDHLGAGAKDANKKKKTPAKKQTKPATEETEPEPEPESVSATEQPKDNSVTGRMASFTTSVKEGVFGKPLSAAQIQQSFCEIASICGGWPDDVIHDMQKMLQNNKSTKKHCPTKVTYILPKKK